MPSDEHMRADNTDTIDILLVSGCLIPGIPNAKVSSPSIIIVIGNP
jgi:hypothetical protein